MRKRERKRETHMERGNRDKWRDISERVGATETYRERNRERNREPDQKKKREPQRGRRNRNGMKFERNRRES